MRTLPMIATLGAALTVGALLCAGSPAAAQDVESGASPCQGPRPVAGVELRGPVLHVLDAQTLCVALNFNTDSWIPLRMADAPTTLPVLKTSTAGQGEPNPRGALMQAALARTAVCRTLAADDGSVEALCEIDGRPLGDLLRDPGVVEASYGWR
jgi:hypothetical protein